MLSIKSHNSRGEDLNSVIGEIVSSIYQENTKLVIFFASSKYDFYQASKLIKEAFPDNDVIGCTTAGEISQEGFHEGTISAMGISADDFQTSTYVMRNIKSRSMLIGNNLSDSGEKIGLNSESKAEGFIIALIDGLQSAEEKVMNTVANAFPHLGIVGGSAGDDGNFKETLVSANGEIFEDAAIITFVKTTKKFFLYKENIFVPTDIQFKVTKSDIPNRIVYEFDGKPAAEEYARVLGITVEELPDYFISNPTGRIIMDNVWIASPMKLYEEKFLKYYCSISPNSTVRILKPIDAIKESGNTIVKIRQNLHDCKGILLFNCILRYKLFKKENLCDRIAQEYAKCGPICGFNTYGEQFNRLHVNQTLTLIAFGE